MADHEEDSTGCQGGCGMRQRPAAMLGGKVKVHNHNEVERGRRRRHSTTSASTQVTSTPRPVASRCALASPAREKSTPVTRQPFEASHTALRPRHRQRQRPYQGRGVQLSTRKRFGSAFQISSSVPYRSSQC